MPFGCRNFTERKTWYSCFESALSSSFIQTIRLVLELHQIMRLYARGLYRQSGISPCPEDISILLSVQEYIFCRTSASIPTDFGNISEGKRISPARQRAEDETFALRRDDAVSLRPQQRHGLVHILLAGFPPGSHPRQQDDRLGHAQGIRMILL